MRLSQLNVNYPQTDQPQDKARAAMDKSNPIPRA